VLLAAMMAEYAQNRYGPDPWWLSGHPLDEAFVFDRKTQIDGCIIAIQQPIKQYVVDFVFMISDRGHYFNIAVECDGHYFHERTKEQAAQDRKRDRELQKDGFIVLRFTGSQIWVDPILCMGQL
jgi:very-short-patch-repair endonuclease